MKIIAENTKPLEKKTTALCYFVYDADTQWTYNSNKIIDSTIIQSIKDTTWKVGTVRTIHTHKTIHAHRVLLVGLGKKKLTTGDTIRIAMGNIIRTMQDLGLYECSIILPNNFDQYSISAIVEGAELSIYSFDKYKTKEKKISEIYILASNHTEINKWIKTAKKITDGVILTRDVANLPPNDCTPSTIAKIAKSLTVNNKIRCKIMSKKELIHSGFNGIISVGQGSKNESKLIILEYNMMSNLKPIVIVGKAVTFDTGGISLKPSEKMDEMKFDKCGGCVVLGIMKIVAELKLPIKLIGVIPSVENMPGGDSYKPGDIIKLYDGKTVEVINTDAEGRLILYDAISYSEKKYSPKTIIDFATLTGACVVALGTNVAGFITNNDNLAYSIKKSSEKTSEDVWQLPLDDHYKDMIKSNIADIKNAGPSRDAGTITAAAFLSHAIKNTPWIHIDIAGTSWVQPTTRKRPYNSIGATAFGVRLMVDYLMNNK